MRGSANSSAKSSVERSVPTSAHDQVQAKRTSTERPDVAQPAIVQCTSCHTKFTFDYAPLREMDQPRFHCSRCDHIFKLEDAQVEFSLRTEGKAPQRAPSEDRTAERAPAPKVAARQQPPAIERPAGVLPRQSKSSCDYETEISYDWDPPLEEPVAASEEEALLEPEHLPSPPRRKASPQSSERQIDLGLTLNRQPHNRTLDSKSHRRAAQEEYRGRRTTYGSDSNRQRRSFSVEEMDVDSNLTSQAGDIYEDPGPLSSRDPYQDAFDYLKASAAKPASTDEISRREPHPNPSHAQVRAPLAGQLGGWKAVSFLAVPVFASVLLLALTSYLLSGAHSTANALAAFSGDDPAIAAPSEVHVIDTAFEKIELQNGESVATVSGVIRNSSGTSYADVIIEAFVYDHRGALVAELRNDIGSSLANTRIKSLTREMIDNLQDQDLGKSPLLKAGESRRIQFAFPKFQFNQATDYSIRVYSVKEAR